MCDFGILISHMKRQRIPGSVASQIVERIKAAGQGSIFLVRDFLDLGSRRAVDETLRRLTAEGALRRLSQGVYDFPRVSALLGDEPVPPDPEAVAAALARRMGASVLPTAAQTANALGVSTQVPARNVFRTNGGKARRVTVGNQTIELRPTAPGQFSQSEAGPIIQALRFLGEENVSEDVIRRLRKETTPAQKEVIAREWRTAPGWMHPALREIAG